MNKTLTAFRAMRAKTSVCRVENSLFVLHQKPDTKSEGIERVTAVAALPLYVRYFS